MKVIFKKGKIILFVFLNLTFFSGFLLVGAARAEETGSSTVAEVEAGVEMAGNPIEEKTDQIFTAQVAAVIEEKEIILDDGTEVRQQKLDLIGLEGKYKGKHFVFDGLNNYDVVAKHLYQENDLVLVDESFDAGGQAQYYVIDYVRRGSLAWLAVIFVLSLLLVGRFKGLKSILSLVLTFVVIVYWVIPGISAGNDPVIITCLGGMAIVLSVIYLSEGWNRISHLAVISIFASMLLTVFLAWIFVLWARLSGLADEEAASLLSLGMGTINFQGLLLAGIIIGALGVLDDVVISQIVAVNELKESSPAIRPKELFGRAMKIGVSHISSMTNTLFLAYAGAALPLLVLFASGGSAFSSWGQIVNNEQIATEIVRTLVGSIGLIAAVPISTALAVWRIGRRRGLTKNLDMV